MTIIQTSLENFNNPDYDLDAANRDFKDNFFNQGTSSPHSLEKDETTAPQYAPRPNFDELVQGDGDTVTSVDTQVIARIEVPDAKSYSSWDKKVADEWIKGKGDGSWEGAEVRLNEKHAIMAFAGGLAMAGAGVVLSKFGIADVKPWTTAPALFPAIMGANTFMRNARRISGSRRV